MGGKVEGLCLAGVTVSRNLLFFMFSVCAWIHTVCVGTGAYECVSESGRLSPCRGVCRTLD